MSFNDAERVAEAARRLSIEPRADRWCHLSLCVIDAVFSVGARYGSTWRAARRYAERAGLEPVTAPAASVAAGDHATTEQTLDKFRADTTELSDDAFADLLGNRQRTSSRGGILKAMAVRQYVEVLTEHQVETLRDVSTLLGDHMRVKEVEAALARVRGHGSEPASRIFGFSGDDHHVKADRMVLGWTSQSSWPTSPPRRGLRAHRRRCRTARSDALGTRPCDLAPPERPFLILVQLARKAATRRRGAR